MALDTGNAKSGYPGHGQTVSRVRFAIPTKGLPHGEPSRAEDHLRERGGRPYLKTWGSRPESKRIEVRLIPIVEAA